MPCRGWCQGKFSAVPAVLASAHEQSVPIFQQLARGYPSGRDDVRAIPAVAAAQRRGSVGRARDRHQPRGPSRFWWNRFGPMFAAEICKRRVAHMRGYPQWRWHLDEVFVRVNGKLCYLWRAVDHEGEVLEAVVTARRDKSRGVLKLLKRIMKKYGAPRSIVTDGLRAYPAAMNEIGVSAARHEVGGRVNNRAENSHQPFRRRANGRCSAFEVGRRCRSSAQFTPRCTTNSIRSAISSRGKVYKQRRSVALAEWRWPRGIDRRSRDGDRAACRRASVTLTPPPRERKRTGLGPMWICYFLHRIGLAPITLLPVSRRTIPSAPPGSPRREQSIEVPTSERTPSRTAARYGGRATSKYKSRDTMPPPMSTSSGRMDWPRATVATVFEAEAARNIAGPLAVFVVASHRVAARRGNMAEGPASPDPETDKIVAILRGGVVYRFHNDTEGAKIATIVGTCLL